MTGLVACTEPLSALERQDRLEASLVNPEFEAWPKTPRIGRAITMVITEKLDGTNAQVHVLPDGRVFAGSRTRYVSPQADNFGFAARVRDHEEELRTGLGPGRHYGEWWGLGIQRGYGLAERRFSLFNVKRWALSDPEHPANVLPACCSLVPVLYEGPLNSPEDPVQACIERLRVGGSVASPGFMQPEGVVVYVMGKLAKAFLPGEG